MSDPSVPSAPEPAALPAAPSVGAVKAAEEYAYVVRDVRRILFVGSILAAALIVAFVLIDVAHVITIG